MAGRSRTVASLLGGLLLGLAPLPAPPPAHAAQMIVTTTTDELTQNGRCSLREAIRNANANSKVHPDCPAGSGADTILLRAGTYTRSITNVAGDEDAAETGDLDITGDLTISGVGATVDANQIDRVFEILGGKTTISPLTIRGGANDGGGLAVGPGATLTLSNAIVAENRGEFGAGLDNRGGTLRLSNTTVRDNNGDRRGGGIRATAGGDAEPITIISGGAITGNAVFEGTQGSGAGIDASGRLELSNVTLRGNQARSVGGGISFGDGVLKINGGSLTGNRTTTSGGGIFVGPDGVAMLTNVRITGNRADENNDGFGAGGGIFVAPGATVTSTNVTVTGNTGTNGQPDNCEPDNTIPGCT